MAGKKLSETAAHLLIPTGITSSEFPLVSRIAAQAGVSFDKWQEGLGTLILAKRADGHYACSEEGATMSICRQAGKTFLVGWIIVASCLIHDNLMVLWTAHRTRTSDETFKDLQNLCKTPLLQAGVKTIRQANGQQEISFTNGSRILFGAREQGFGRGFSGVGIEVFDEAQILTQKALDDMIPAMNASANALTLFMGTPPTPSDPSDVFTTIRDRALNQAPTGMLYVEFAADKNANPDDRKQWKKANPSYPARTNEASIIRMRSLLPEDSFKREALGIWDEKAVQKAAIDPHEWEATTVPGKPDNATPSIGIDMNPQRTAISIACCWKNTDGAHIQLINYKNPSQAGTQWAIDYITSKWDKLAAVVIDGQSPAINLITDLQDNHVKVTVTRAYDMAKACGRFMDMLHAKTLTHKPDEQQEPLALAVQAATTRPVGQAGAFAWNRKDTDSDISPLVACTLALHGAYTARRNPGRKQQLWS